MQGIIVVNKEEGLTSRDVVNSLCSIFSTKKVGHTGTLDPMAKGVLIICFGRYTKLVDYITSASKEYTACVKLGVLTDTLDVTGKILETKDYAVDENKIKCVLKSFEKTYMQEPPMYSAIKINGKKLYEYARNNEAVSVPKRSVTIYENKLIDIFSDGFSFRSYVSKGTYIRSLILDISKSLNTVGVMSDLVRTKQGKISIENSFSIDEIKDGKYEVLYAKDVLDCPLISLSESEVNKVYDGVKIEKEINDGLYLLTFLDEEIALYEFINKLGRMKVLLKVKK